MKKVKMSLMSAKERENALNEIRILASLSSPYIVEYKDSFLDPEMSILCVIMEFASGGDLTKMVNEGKLKGGVDEAELWRALTQMTLGLKALHDLKILHRDLKCANVFTLNTPQGIVYKLGDLNISKVTKGAAAKTQAGTPCT
jgi:NIMA (never in mitosis gene a)-related kinase